MAGEDYGPGTMPTPELQAERQVAEAHVKVAELEVVDCWSKEEGAVVMMYQ